ncbi:T9SS type A sorting domain-containing protein [Flavihumibacter sp.]|uniref:T9SS type A sorting domain-containing protein n=1 Tax=Flavihumibacter sp. TaxID=1913981 RepID=UPI002FC9B080
MRLLINRDNNKSENSSNYSFNVAIIEIPLNNRSFKTEFQLPAEMRAYQFQLFGIQNGVQSTLPLVQADNVVSGDVFMIQGQSNAAGTGRAPYNSSNSASDDPEVIEFRRFIRAYGRSSQIEDGPYSNMPKQWFTGNGNAVFTMNGNVGQWAMWMATNICRTEGIPVAIINHAVSGKPVSYYKPNLADKFDLNTSYGRALMRSKDAGVLDSIRAFFWFQGESNWGGGGGIILNSDEYKAELETIISEIQNDIPSLRKVYLFQTRWGCWGLENDAAEIADAIRRVAINTSYNKVVLISTNGIPQAFEDSYCHYYYRSGYRKIGIRAFNNLERDIYGKTFPAGSIDAPMPKTVYFSTDNNGNATELVLELNSTDDFSFSAVPIAQIIALFTLNGGNYTINSLAIDNGPVGNNIIPTKIRINFSRNGGTLNNPTSISFRTYRGGYSTPASSNETLLPEPVVPAIINSSGIGLVSFNNFTTDGIGILPIDPLSLFVRRTGNTNNVKWEVEENSDFVRFAVERSTNGTNFSMLTELFGKATSGKEVYNYADVNITGQVFYRIKATRKTGGVVYSQVVRINDNGSLRPGLTISPNPVINQAFINVTVAEKTSASIQLFNLQGARVSQRNVELLKGSNNFSLGEMLDQLPGVYMVKVVTPQEVFTSRLIKLR